MSTQDVAKAIIDALPRLPQGLEPRWGTVTQIGPIRVRFDGETDPLQVDPVDLVGVSLNSRVWCLLYAGQVFLVGSPSSAPVQAIPAGTMHVFGGSVVPSGYLLCDGASYSTATYPALSAALGSAGPNFTVPNMKGRTVVGRDSTDSDFNTVGKTGGAKTHTLAVSEMPSHSHSHSNYGTTAGSTYGYAVISANASGNTSSLAMTNTGGGGAHNNLQPYASFDWIIKT